MTPATFTIVRYRRETHFCNRHFSDAVCLLDLLGINYVMRGIPTNQPSCDMCIAEIETKVELPSAPSTGTRCREPF